MRRPTLAPAIALIALAACGSPRSAAPASEPPAPTVPAASPPATPARASSGAAPGSGPTGRIASGATVRLEIRGGSIARVTDVAGGQADAWLWPPIIDSHVHLAYWPVAGELVKAGVAAAVDLAAPEDWLGPRLAGETALHVLAAGPMLTREHGYPLASWGSAGYGIGCRDAACVTQAVDRLASHGAQVIKLALDDDGLDPALVPAAVAAAERRQRKVCVHALSERSAQVAARAGVDCLAHTPVEPLSDATVALWRGRAVISTLAAFGGSAAAVDNLRRLRAAGAIVLYGTDLGNTRVAGPNPDELALLRQAGLDDAAITAAMTTAPAAYWGLCSPSLADGSEASFVVLDGDPRRDAAVLLAPRAAWLRGQRVR